MWILQWLMDPVHDIQVGSLLDRGGPVTWKLWSNLKCAHNGYGDYDPNFPRPTWSPRACTKYVLGPQLLMYADMLPVSPHKEDMGIVCWEV